MSVVFDFAQEAQRVQNTLQDAFGPNAAIRVDEGWHGRVHVKIVSNAFDGKSEDAKQTMVWGRTEKPPRPQRAVRIASSRLRVGRNLKDYGAWTRGLHIISNDVEF